MPVVMRKSGQQDRPSPEGASDASPAITRAAIPTPVFVAVILLVVLVVAILAYRSFGPPPKWDNAREGQPVDRSVLSAPPPVARHEGTPGKPGAGDQGTPQTPAGTELPPDVR